MSLVFGLAVVLFLNLRFGMADFARWSFASSELELTSVVFFWLYFYDPPTQLRSLLAATAYTFIEYIFTGYENSDNFTSFAQFWGNLLYTPILLDVYWSVVVGSSDGGMPSALQAMSYVMLFPFNVWLLEIVLEILLEIEME